MSQSRRQFVGRIALAAGAGVLGVKRPPAEASPGAALPRWARLITSFPQWNRHQPEDESVNDFIVAHGARIAPGRVPAVHPAQRAELEKFALLFTDNLLAVREPQQLVNLRGYLELGGFIYVDICWDPNVTAAFLPVYRAHMALFRVLLPSGQTRLLTPEHPIFSALTRVKESEAVPNGTPGGARWAGTQSSLWGVYEDDRLAILYSQEHLRCNWGTSAAKMGLVANIHAYGMGA